MSETVELDFPFRFSLPAGFTDLDLTATIEERANELLDSIDVAFPSLSNEERLRLVLANQFAVEQLVETGARFVSNFVGRSEVDSSAASTAQLSVLLLDGLGDARRPLDVIAESIRLEDRDRHTQFVDLQIGRCLVVIDETAVHAQADLRGEHPPEATSVRQLQVMFPLPEQRRLAIFAMSTTCLRDWDDYVDMMTAICQTIEWADTGEVSRISAVLNTL
ncbi:hypothetical protein [Amycolatopsis sp. CA-230715]|uniref:hypothetical protein n=1 Tax=Amycolatopsis sp. CA-230715 TaxID=2745196 RepID=UPI001C025A9A|nr:hypothetical protein [Amycolatopsis sp. CA-230715]QWF84221.1 hypothetical protein HUW46_07670 [Amycolatopsis sp. CA-230715]